MNHDAFVRTIKVLPPAFDNRYWNMANTSFREEIAITYLEENSITGAEAKSILRRCGILKKDSLLTYLWVEGKVEQIMGMYVAKEDSVQKQIDKFYR